MAQKEFRLPDVGEGLTEADIVAWHVKPGDTVRINQVIVDIETAKAVVELPSPYAGTVSALLVDVGQTVDVGTPIIAVDVPSADGAEPEPAKPAQQPGGQADAASQEPGPPETGSQDTDTKEAKDAPQENVRQPVLVGYGVKPGSTRRRARKQPPTRPGSYPATPSAPPSAPPPAPPGGGPGPAFPAGIKLPPGIPAPPAVPAQGQPAPGRARALAKPPVRRLARDLGVDLGALSGSGPEGSVTRDDVERAASASRNRSAAEDQVPGGQVPEGQVPDGRAHGAAGSTSATAEAEERIPVRGVRKHTAAAMVTSAFTAPHVTEFLQVDVTETMAAVRRARDLPEFAGVRVSPLLFVAKALLVAARRHPMINSSWDEAAQEIVVKRPVNLGLAVAAERGLLVPNVKGADTLPLADLARAIDELATTARSGKATPADMAGGTITITNVGVFGVDAGTPILMPGEAAILAFGQVRDMPWVVAGELAVRKVTTLSLSFDHRIVDGELGSAVLRDVGSMLEDPLRMLTWS
ncbi:2-oxo acid dehydrogenase subunit E2 [Trebonia kvetii]|uniref:Dihydrolipoamide acetyltransferase component of pyruvate dehydrogenase complex n=1 Tax=Trebonia kvetii TaxID=2480626 RepID=A0A6P2BT99_9ACTN|nr:dihydrolipoamide acetyltransferase family protein [Trebonia kvetii]TVZ01591.1 2-oxo acid dehydrogenase subunit E2 [Trebonia kvetii]